MPIIGGGNGSVNIVAAGVAGLAALMADVDSQYSQINQMNPLTGTANKIVNTGENVLKALLRIVFTIGIGIGIFYFRSDLILVLQSFSKIRSYASVIVYGAAALFLLFGLSGKKGERMLSNIPIIGDVYCAMAGSVDKGGSLLKKMMMVIVYGGIGLWIMKNNLSHGQDPYLYLIGGLFIAAVIFPHRSFFHSIEGLILFSAAVTYLTDRIGHPELQQAFLIGYISHLYLTDIFTKEGVPLSIIPRVLEKIGLHKHLRRFAAYKLLHKALSIPLRVPIMSTGSKMGNTIEEGYVFVLLAASVISFFAFDGAIKLI
jgi:hypothetical protein